MATRREHSQRCQAAAAAAEARSHRRQPITDQIPEHATHTHT
eukprot:COSAG03_NODE_18902_length_346_cov_0.631579_1_plen_41_part_10